MAKTINALKARQNFGELLNEVFYRKESVIIERAGKEMAVILSVEVYKKLKTNQEEFKNKLREAVEQLKTSHESLAKLLKDLHER